MDTQQWRFEPELNKITAIDRGNCRITIADKIFGVSTPDWLANGRLMAMAPRLIDFVHLVLVGATIETDKKVLQEAEDIINELKQSGHESV